MRAPASLVVLAAAAACGGSERTGAGGLCAFPPPVPARATTYAGPSAGACMLPAGLSLYAAVSPAVYAGSAGCGTCLEVTGPAATATVKITDLCPECATNQLDLSTDAWNAVTGSAPAGVANVGWRRVPCDEPGPVRFVAGAGANPWFVLVVVQDHRYPIAAVEVLPAGAPAWLPLARDAANQWARSAGGAGYPTPLHFRAMDAFGRVTTTTVPMAALEAGAVATAPQLDVCG